MAEFAIQRGPIPLCIWDVSTGKHRLHPQATHYEGCLVLGEADRRTFVIRPVSESVEWRISIGDVPIAELFDYPSDADGMVVLDQLVWREWNYFESAKGETRLTIQSRPVGNELAPWNPILLATVYVMPTKVTGVAYERMANDLKTIGRSLLIDLYGKSSRTCDVRFARDARAFHSREEELDAITVVTDRLGVLIYEIQRRPSSRVERRMMRGNFWGTQRLAPRAIARLASEGVSVRSVARPLPVLMTKTVETFDIVEHRILKAFLSVLGKRVSFCASAARRHIQMIEAERALRDVQLGPGPSLYESIDVPKIQRLKRALREAQRLRRVIQTMEALPLFEGVQPDLAAGGGGGGGAFGRSEMYRELQRVIRSFLMSHSLHYEGDEFAVITKLTSRLFEQWCFLRIVNALRDCGLNLGEWEDVLQSSLESRFILDFERGMRFEGLLTSEIKLRVRYEPWILGERAASTRGETLCRGSEDPVAWSPDIVVECLNFQDGRWEPIYVIVLDCKYTGQLREQHWNDTRKYTQIRSTRSRRQVVRQLWLVFPGNNEGIASVDPAVTFGENGASSPKDESVSFSMSVDPGNVTVAPREPSSACDVFHEFAKGTTSYIRRELI